MAAAPRILFWFLVGLSGCASLEITRLTVPSFVANGSEESVLLDCEYSYSPKEDRKLVVKWFHEDDPNPVYQWIPELGARLFSDKFRLDEEYVLPGGDEYTRARAIQMRKPTTEMSGTYKCEVQSLEGSDVQEDDMIVYALPTSVSLNYSSAQDGEVEVSCEVSGVFPLPDISLFRIRPRTVDRAPINDTFLLHEMRGGAYELRFATRIPESELREEGPTFFGCTVRVPGTDYEKEVKVPYFPNPIAEKQEGDDSDNKSSGLAACASSVVSFTILMFLLT